MDTCFPLVDAARYRGVQVLDGIFNGEYMVRTVLIDQIYHGGHGRGFATACRAGKKYQALVQFGEALKLLWQPEFSQRWRPRLNGAEYGINAPLLLVGVSAKTAGSGDVISEIKLELLFQSFALRPA